MAKQKSYFLYPLLIFVFLITLVSGNWSLTYAADTDPSPQPTSSAFPSPQTRPPSTPSTPVAPSKPTFPPPPIGNLCSPEDEEVSPTVEGLLGCYPWVVYIPTGVACSDGIAVVYDLPIANNPPPYHWKMINDADSFEVRLYSSTLLVKDPPCGNLNVIFYLKSWQRQIYDKTPDQLSIYHYDEAAHTWTDCKPTLVSDVGLNGVLLCSMKNWGFYSLGHLSGQ
jgi:hypothetical protein